ncbi:MAG: polysaccharide deacetylase family protein [Hyphomicrobiaceae bacterium]|nr:polysaccharide deacetylase family protein [Hyphomicrobiaceae bacterium]
MRYSYAAAVVGIVAGLLTASHASAATCAGNAKALGVARTVEIDTTGAPGFGFEHYKAYDFLEKGEVVLTFDDGPLPTHTRTILKALADHCAKATFFPVGKLSVGYPEVLREVISAGHTVGGHTYNHIDLAKAKDEQAVEEIERGFSAVKMGSGLPTAPFFRHPFLRHSKNTLDHLAKRNIAIFSTDIDSFDFKIQSPERIVDTVMKKLEKHGKGIILMHDIQPSTAKALPVLLDSLKEKGYRLVHLTAKDALTTVAKYDETVKGSVQGMPEQLANRPTSSVVKTVKTAP